MRPRSVLVLVGLFAVPAAVAFGACSDSVPSDQGSTTTVGPGTGGSPTGDAGPTDAGPSCYPNPTTYLEIINACTDAQAVAVSPVLPLLLPDGGLPPLP